MEKPAFEIGPGKQYYVQYAAVQFKVAVLRAAVATPGWWLCQTGQNEQAIFPESAFMREANDSPA